MRPVVSIVVAMDERNAIGRAGGLPWRLPEDLKRFKSLMETGEVATTNGQSHGRGA